MKKLIGFTSIMFIAVFALVACSNPTAPAADKLQVGDKAPAFSLKNVDGKTVSLNDYKGKGAIIVFTCNHCPFSIMYEDRIIELQKEYGATYPVIAINPNSPEAEPSDSYEEMIVRAKEKSFNFPYLFDDGQKVYPQYGAERTPHVFVLDKNHVVQYIGAIDDNARAPESVEVNYVKDAIKAIDAGSKPDPNFTKAIGCTIKA